MSCRRYELGSLRVVAAMLFNKITPLCDSGHKILILGDLNARIGSLNSNPMTRNSADLQINDRGKDLFVHICNSGLSIGNGTVDGDHDGSLTFISESNTGASVVDLFIYSHSLSPLIQQFSVLSLTYSDHFPISVTLNLADGPNAEARIPTVSKTKVVIPNNKTEIDTLRQMIDMRLTSLAPSEDVEELNSQLINSLISTLTSQNLIRQPRLIHPKPLWFDKECRSLKFNMNQSLCSLRRNDNSINRSEYESRYRTSRSIYTKYVESRVEQEKRQNISKLTNTKSGSSFWSTFKRMNPSPASSNPINSESWFKHFTSVFSIPGGYHVAPILLQPDYNPDPILDTDFNVFEVKMATKKLKPGKAAGNDLIPNEIWKFGSAPILLLLCSLFQLCLDRGRVPLSWCEVIICPLLKKGDNKITSNYRPISLLNTVVKLFTSILNTRLNSWIKTKKKISEFQAGFQQGKSSLDHVFVLNSMVQIQLLKKKKLYACFVDLSQAFDSPDHNRLWTVLLKLGVSAKFVRVFSYLYAYACAKVRSADGVTGPIKIMKGVLQGESASPSIFNLFLEDIVNRLENSNIAGIKLQLVIVHILLYADDMVIVAPSQETLQMKISVVSRFLKERGLQINFGKTKIVVFRRAGNVCISDRFFWNGSQIEVVKSYTYLGITFHSSGKFNLASSEFVKKGLSAQGAALSTVKRLKLFNLNISIKLYNSIIRSITLYGAGIWGLRHAEPLERVQQHFLKRTLNLPISTPRYFVRLETGQPHISMEILKLSLNMLERILKSPKNSLLYNSYSALRRVSTLFPEQEYSWCLQIENILRTVGCENVWNRNSANVLCSFRSTILNKHRQNLGAADLNLAKNSSSLPHYFSLVNGFGAERYLQRNLPVYLVNCITQIRLNYSIVFHNGKWINLGMFDERLCSRCGERDSFSHVFECSQLSELRAKILPSSLLTQLYSFDKILEIVKTNIDQYTLKRVYIYISSVLCNR
jgi:hypothetical protein